MKEIIDFAIVKREQFGDRYFQLVLSHPHQLQPVMPGQFVEVEVKGTRDVMLRRPISIQEVDADRGTLTLLIQIVGKGTTQLAKLTVGEHLSVIYPLGNGFSVAGSCPLLVGGGAGIAPLLYLAKCYNAKGVRPTILLGGRTASLIPGREAYEEYGDVCYATEDGSLGIQGFVTQHPRFVEQYDHIATCGPTPMMKAVARHAVQHGIDCEVSLENMMACGIGACLCCVTNTTDGHKCDCKTGPVFDPRTLVDFV